MPRGIRRAAVLGAGLMGSQIAAHLANVGIPSILLDIVPSELTAEEAKQGLTLQSPQVRNRYANQAVSRLQTMKPSPLYTQDALELIQRGNLEDDLHRVAEVDWIVEAVVEKLPVKQALWQKVAALWKPGTVASSNTSGLPIHQIAAGLPEELRRHFLGTHFFNPPRYMRLLELIPTPETDPSVTAFLQEFGERVLGKGVVIAKDTPNFIANRIGCYGMMVTLHAMQQVGLRADEVDTITGPVLGRPRSATFRTLDLVGLDTFVHVADNIRETIPDPTEQEAFAVPEPLREMVRRGWTGNKGGQGFYKKVGDEIQTLDLATLEYTPRKKGSFTSVEAAKPVADLKERLRILIYAEDKAGRFAWAVLKRTLLYTAGKVGEIADDIVSIDRAMRWGFNWEMGPFETWDAIGLSRSIERMEAEGETVPDWVRQAAAAGGFYKRESPLTFYLTRSGEHAPVEADARVIDMDALPVVRQKKGATLRDMSDGVLLLETHSPKSAIGADILALMKQGAELLETGEWRGMVLGARTEDFCVGANLMMLLMAAQDGEWDEVNMMVRQFQGACMAIKYAPRPVVAAPYGLTLGGGWELIAHCDRVVAANETYMGLVEVGAGLIPGGGGNKEMLIRTLESLPSSGGGLGGAAQMAAGSGLDLQPVVNKLFETVGMAKVATSGPEARAMGYLRRSDRTVANRDHLLHEAKQEVLEMDRAGYSPPRPARIPVSGPEGRAVLELGLYNLRLSGYLSEYDSFIGKKLAWVLTGGSVPAGTVVTEQYLLDIEREAFISLCKEKKSQARMQHILKTGKPLRN